MVESETGMQNPIFKIMMGNNDRQDNINPNSMGMNNQMDMNNMNQMMNNQLVMNNMNLMKQYNQMNQNNDINKIEDNDPMNLMNQNINRVNQIFGVSKFKDEFPEINEPKNCIYYIRNDDGKRFGILIPYSLKSDELYPIAEKYKLHKYSDLKLFYKNNYLREDETPIGHISFGDEINIVEEFSDIDFTYYQSYLSRNNKKKND